MHSKCGMARGHPTEPPCVGLKAITSSTTLYRGFKGWIRVPKAILRSAKAQIFLATIHRVRFSINKPFLCQKTLRACR